LSRVPPAMGAPLRFYFPLFPSCLAALHRFFFKGSPFPFPPLLRGNRLIDLRAVNFPPCFFGDPFQTPRSAILAVGVFGSPARSFFPAFRDFERTGTELVASRWIAQSPFRHGSPSSSDRMVFLSLCSQRKGFPRYSTWPVWPLVSRPFPVVVISEPPGAPMRVFPVPARKAWFFT